MSFVNLHAHSHYSLLDGFGTPEDIILRAKELGYTAAALTDHGVTYGLIEFYKAGIKHGVKPILGCELYIAPRTLHDKEANIDVKPYHLTVLAKNNAGYSNLLKLVTVANLDGFYYKPRVDYDVLKEHAEGLIACSGCIAGHLPRAILSQNETEIKFVIDKHIEIFGEANYFLEMQDNPLFDNQTIVNEGIKRLSKEHNLPMIVTCDSHYPRPKDAEAHDIMLCIQTGSIVSDVNRMRYSGDFSIRDVKDLEVVFSDTPEALSNTLKIAEMCDISFDFGNNLIPSFQTPDGQSAEAYLRELCVVGLSKRFGSHEVPKNYLERLDFELVTVNKMGFDTYFLIVSDFVRFAKDQNIIVGPGRGSAAGSIIAWSLNITDVDPIKYGLFFERFLNPERISMPDIDIDFADTRRDEVLAYVIDKYGRDKVAQILTFGTMAPRAAVRDVGRALGYPYAEVDSLAKTIPPPILGKSAPLKESIVDDQELRKIYEGDPRAKVLLDHAKELEGSIRHTGTHACAVVISELPLTNYTALQYGASGNKDIVTQYSAKPLEDLGLLKMDFLGLRNLTVIEKTREILGITQKKTVNIEEIPLNDKKTFKLLQNGDTLGVFQLESAGMRRYLKDLKPTVFEDIVAMGALYRPGPMEWIPTYIKGKHNIKKVNYLHPSFKKILETTYGVAVYQEQILQIARDFAGFSLGEADILRKAVGKKDPELLAEQRDKFVKGAVSSGHKIEFATEVFEKVIEPFAGYGFNRAHAVCYGLIAYRTAYLKAHFPIEFMTALFCSDPGNMDRIVLIIKECLEMGIDILPPSINESFGNFTVVGKKKIRFGLLAIKGVGEGPVNEIVAEREKGGPFTSIENFASRVPLKVLNKKVVQALSYAGALDDFGDRNVLAESYEEISLFAKGCNNSSANGQTSIFGIMDEAESLNCSFSMKDVPPATKMQCLKWEKEFLGLYVSGHPLAAISAYLKRKSTPVASLSRRHLNKTVKLVGLVSGLRRIVTKTGANMAVFVVEDPTARVNVIMFPKTMSSFGMGLADGIILSLSGKFDDKRGQFQVVCDMAKPLSLDVMIENSKEAGLYDPNDKSGIYLRLIDDIIYEQDQAESSEADKTKQQNMFTIDIPNSADAETMQTLKDLLLRSKGDTPVELYLSSADKKIKLPFCIKLTDELKSSIDSLLILH